MGASLRSHRQKRGYSLEEVARLTGLSARTVHRAEKGNPMREETLRRIAEALGLSMTVVFHDPSDGEADCACVHPPSGGEAPAPGVEA